jgi:hypothetical protein
MVAQRPECRRSKCDGPARAWDERAAARNESGRDDQRGLADRFSKFRFSRARNRRGCGSTDRVRATAALGFTLIGFRLTRLKAISRMGPASALATWQPG